MIRHAVVQRSPRRSIVIRAHARANRHVNSRDTGEECGSCNIHGRRIGRPHWCPRPADRGRLTESSAIKPVTARTTPFPIPRATVAARLGMALAPWPATAVDICASDGWPDRLFISITQANTCHPPTSDASRADVRGGDCLASSPTACCNSVERSP